MPEKNVAKFSGVEIISSAVSLEDGEVDVFDPGLGNNAFRTSSTEDDLVGRVQAESVRSLLAQYSPLNPLIVKIDIEGIKSTLFEGETAWIDAFKVIAIEIHD